MATLTRRVEVLEEKMEGLADLPDRVTRLENEMRSGFDAVRVEMREGLAKVREEIRADIRAGDEETQNRMLILHEAVVDKLKLLRDGIDRVNGGAKRRRSFKSPER